MSDPTLAEAMAAARTFQDEMYEELAGLSATAEATGDYAWYDESAADLRAAAADHLATVLAAYDRETA